MTELTTDRVTRLEAYKDALDAAGVEYDTRVTYRIELAENGTDATSEATKAATLPSEGTKARDLVEWVAEHPKEWVTAADAPERFLYSQGSYLSVVNSDFDVFNTRNTGRGHATEYRLKEAYRRELTAQSIDVDVLTEARNA